MVQGLGISWGLGFSRKARPEVNEKDLLAGASSDDLPCCKALPQAKLGDYRGEQSAGDFGGYEE